MSRFEVDKKRMPEGTEVNRREYSEGGRLLTSFFLDGCQEDPDNCSRRGRIIEEGGRLSNKYRYTYSTVTDHYPRSLLPWVGRTHVVLCGKKPFSEDP